MGVQLGFMGVQLGWQGHRGRFTGLRLRCGDGRAAAGGCHCASLMMKRRAAAAAVRPCPRPGPGSPLSSFPQVTCLDRPGRPVLAPLFACGMRARPALAVLAWSGDGSPVRGCTTTSGDRVPLGHFFDLSLLAWIFTRAHSPTGCPAPRELVASGYVADGNRQLVWNLEFCKPAVKRLAEVSDSLFRSLPLAVRACPVDHGTGSRSQMLIEATSMVPW